MFEHLRQEYAGTPLTKRNVDPDPIAQFRRWFSEAEAAGVPMANGMTLATVGADGQPSARIVLLKAVDERGFSFVTNYDSRKGVELAANPCAALLFWWAALHRQVRVEGAVEKLPAAESDAYFAARPRTSNVSALASEQSRPVESREALEARVAQVPAGELSRPAHWGGYVLRPDRLELWQGRADRLHDRLEYHRGEDGTWTIRRLCP